LRCLAKALFEAGENGVERPAHRVAAMDRAVGNTVDDFYRGFTVIIPAKQGDAAAFSA
jgi:hypothetical protein